MSAAASRPVIEVAVVQAGEVPADHDVALDELIALFEEAAVGADLVVFPELCTTPQK
jgi:beta-ureidopropionase